MPSLLASLPASPPLLSSQPQRRRHLRLSEKMCRVLLKFVNLVHLSRMSAISHPEVMIASSNQHGPGSSLPPLSRFTRFERSRPIGSNASSASACGISPTRYAQPARVSPLRQSSACRTCSCRAVWRLISWPLTFLGCLNFGIPLPLHGFHFPSFRLDISAALLRNTTNLGSLFRRAQSRYPGSTGTRH